MSIDGLKQGDAPATVFFDILASRIYRKQLVVLDRRGVLFAIADDVKIAAPPIVIEEIVDSFVDIAWNEAGLTTQVVKNKIYVQLYAREGWTKFLAETPRNPLAALPIHDIPDGSFLTNPFDALNTRLWNDEDGINVLGTPLGSSDFIESYLFGKGIKHRRLLTFIQEVAEAGFLREDVAMLTGAAGLRLTHLLKLVERNSSTEACMDEGDGFCPRLDVVTLPHFLTGSGLRFGT